MKINCRRADLWEAFQTASAVAPSRSPKEILTNVKLEATGEETILMATDLEVGVRVAVSGVEVEQPGSALLPIARFGSILREMPDDTLLLVAGDKGLEVKGERSEFKLPAGNPEEFPSPSAFAEEKYHELPARFLRELIRRTIYATDNESSRYALGGVLFEFEAGQVTCVATDGRRLAKMGGPVNTVGEFPESDQMTIIPNKALQLIERSLGDSDAEVRIAPRGNDVLIQSPRVTVYARLLEGRFPRWRDVFPKRDSEALIELPVAPFHSCVRQAAIMISEESRGVDFTFGQGNAQLSGEAAETGESHVELPISYDGEAREITLDPKYVSDFLKVLDPEKTFSLHLADPNSAAICTTDDGYGYVIMPMARGQR